MWRRLKYGDVSGGLFAALTALAIMTAPAVEASPAAQAASDQKQIAALEQKVADLEAALLDARQALEEARSAESELAAESGSDRIRIGPLTIGGAMRINYILGSYTDESDGPSRGGDGGNFQLDTFRINMELASGPLIGALEYRWYNGYNFLHTGWLGVQFEDDSQLQFGMTRVPFGPGPYGVSQSWFFDQHYYVGLADDMDFGIRYVTEKGPWMLDLAYFFGSGGSWNGSSEDSARYSYDAVTWTGAIDDAGNVTTGDPVNGYEENNQLNARVIYQLDLPAAQVDLGASLQYGELEGKRADDGNHWAASAHMVSTLGNLTVAAQLSRYEVEIDDDNSLETDQLFVMGAYDFPWPVATKAWIPALSVSYNHATSGLAWLDSVRPYIEYSNIIKDEASFNDSQMVTLGAAWARGGWYVYTDLVYSNGNLFIGDEGDRYSNIFDGVGDFGVTGNDQWNYRLNINFGYYF